MAAQRVSAIRVACAGEARDAIKEYQIYSILDTHEIFEKGETSQLSALVGCPLVLLKLRPSLLENVVPRKVQKERIKPGKQYSHQITDRFYPNIVASTLMVELPALAPAAGWKERVGSVLIARKDKGPLHMLHLSVLVGFARAAAGHNREHGTPFEQMLTPAQFQMYYPVAVQHLQMDRSCPADVENVPPLFGELHDVSMDVETGGVAI